MAGSSMARRVASICDEMRIFNGICGTESGRCTSQRAELLTSQIESRRNQAPISWNYQAIFSGKNSANKSS